MTHEHIAAYKSKLEQELHAVEEELGQMGRKSPSVPGTWDATSGDIDETATERDELADRQEEYEENRNEIDALEVQFHNIKRALGKIADGTYGVCEVSGHEIESERLDANPSARTCMEHMEEEKDLPL